MLEVKIPIEIQAYKSKLIFGLSVRQIVSIAGAIACALLIGTIGRGRISSDILPWIIIAVTVPWAMFGFFTFQGLKFEDYLPSWINFNFNPRKRVYEDTEGSLLQSIHEELIEEKIVDQRIEAGELEIAREEVIKYI